MGTTRQRPVGVWVKKDDGSAVYVADVNRERDLVRDVIERGHGGRCRDVFVTLDGRPVRGEGVVGEYEVYEGCTLEVVGRVRGGTHLSPFSYVDRVICNVLLFSFLCVYCFVFFDGMADLRWRYVYKLGNYRSVVILLLLCAIVLSMITDIITIAFKYREGYIDSCVLDCGPINATTNTYTCVHESPSTCPSGIVLRPVSDYWSDRDKDVLVPTADTTWNLGVAFRTSGYALYLASFNWLLRHTLSTPLQSRSEVRFLVFYSIFRFLMFFILVFGLQELHTLIPQLYYLGEITVMAVLILVLICRIDSALNHLPRNFAKPQGMEAFMLYLKWLNYLLAIFFLLEALGLGVINISTLVEHYTTNDEDKLYLNDNPMLVDIFTKIYSAGFLLSPIIPALILFQPANMIHGFTMKGGVATATNGSHIEDEIDEVERNTISLQTSKSLSDVELDSRSAEVAVNGKKAQSLRDLLDQADTLLVRNDIDEDGGQYLLNALLNSEPHPTTKAQTEFKPLSEYDREQEEAHAKEYHDQYVMDGTTPDSQCTIDDIHDDIIEDEDYEEVEEESESNTSPSGNYNVFKFNRANGSEQSSEEEVKASSTTDENEEAEMVTTSAKMKKRVSFDVVENSNQSSSPRPVEMSSPRRPGEKPQLVINTNTKNDFSLTMKESENVDAEIDTAGSLELELPTLHIVTESPGEDDDYSSTSGSTEDRGPRFWQQSKATNPEKYHEKQEQRRLKKEAKAAKKQSKKRSGPARRSSSTSASFRFINATRKRGGSLAEKMKEKLGVTRPPNKSDFGVLTPERRMELAELWLKDALENREPKLHRVRGLPLTLYRVIHSTWWKFFLYIIVTFMLVGLPFMEPISTLGLTEQSLKDYPHYTLAIGLNFFFIMVFCVDAGMTLFTYGLSDLDIMRFKLRSIFRLRSRRSTMFHLHLAVLLISLTNIIIAWADPTVYRLDRIIRWTVLVSINVTLQNMFCDFTLTFSHFMGVFAMYVFVIAVYGLLGIAIFDDKAYSDARDRFWGNETENPTNMYRVDTFPWLAMNLYVLTSLEGFPDYLWPAYDYTPFLAFIYWVSFVIVAIIFLQGIAVPLVYIPLQNQQRSRLMASKIAERKALVAAFEILDAEERFYLDMEVVDDLLRRFSSREDAKIIMRLLDEDGNGTIDLLEFFQIVDTIKLKIRVKEEVALLPYVNICGMSILRKPFIQIKESCWFRYTGDLLTIVMLVILGLYRYIPFATLVIFAGIYLAYLVFESFIHAIAGKLHSTSNGKQFFVVRSLYIAVEVLIYLIFVGTCSTLDCMNDTQDFYLFMVLQVMLVAHIYRVLNLIKTLKNILYVLNKLRGVLSTIMLIVFCLMYGYTMFGMDLFWDNEYTTNPDEVTSDFASFPRAFITVFQLLTGEQWNNVFYISAISVDVSWGYWFLAVGYYFSFNLIVNLYILSIVLAIFLDAFLVFRNIKEDMVSEFVDKGKAAKILGIQEKKYLLFRKLSLEETLYEDFLQQNSKNTFQELLDLGIIRNVGAVTRYTTVGEDKRPIFNLKRYGTSIVGPNSPRSASTPRILSPSSSRKLLSMNGGKSGQKKGMGSKRRSNRTTFKPNFSKRTFHLTLAEATGAGEEVRHLSRQNQQQQRENDDS